MTTMLYVECHPVFHISVSVFVSISQSSELSIAPLVASSADWLSFRPHVSSSPSSHHQWTLTVPTADKSTQPVPHPRWTEMKLSSAHQSAVSLVKLSHDDFAQFFNQLRQLIQSPLEYEHSERYWYFCTRYLFRIRARLLGCDATSEWPAHHSLISC